ncbi:hypothetical protein DFR86_03635 [Acidianus sulfidivorans JP7]|uniref:DUF403 domain-containing protein n=1 Tax=Acidianus sulfidivorans JP7 TaxID=619593 RepID=A0A2U9ILD4_9CREN|nr:hypothetical protein [Acidianus sulfidivorans]AWR96734.1 hypothetical protein DFR86_03635 [Acidianus sulfidivorans JP7]
MITKSTQYKIFWAGRYLERIENITRTSLLLIDKGISLEELQKYLGIGNQDIIKYIQNNFEILREDIRSFGNEKIINALTSLEGAVYSSTDQKRDYFSLVLRTTLHLGEIIEDEISPKNVINIPKKQEEIRTQSI